MRLLPLFIARIILFPGIQYIPIDKYVKRMDTYVIMQQAHDNSAYVVLSQLLSNLRFCTLG
jgi:ribosomal protein L5